RFGHLTRKLDTPISNHRDPLLVGLGSTIRNRSDLRHTYPGNYTCGANTARSDPDLHRVRAGTDELLRGLSSGNVSCNHLQFGILLLGGGDRSRNVHVMAVSGIHAEHVGAS